LENGRRNTKTRWFQSRPQEVDTAQGSEEISSEEEDNGQKSGPQDRQEGSPESDGSTQGGEEISSEQEGGAQNRQEGSPEEDGSTQSTQMNVRSLATRWNQRVSVADTFVDVRKCSVLPLTVQVDKAARRY
jgi:hypothetical protein